MVVAGDMLFESKRFDINGVVEFFNVHAGKSAASIALVPSGHIHSCTSFTISTLSSCRTERNRFGVNPPSRARACVHLFLRYHLP